MQTKIFEIWKIKIALNFENFNFQSLIFHLSVYIISIQPENATKALLIVVNTKHVSRIMSYIEDGAFCENS